MLHPNDCASVNAEMHLFYHHGTRNTAPYYTVDANIAFDCATADGHFTANALVHECR